MNQLNEQFEVRPPRLEDVEVLNSMHAQSWLETYPNEAHGVTQSWVKERVTEMRSQTGIERRKKYIENYLEAPDKELLYRIAVDKNDSVAGFVVGTKTTENQELVALYLDSKVIGSGLAQVLFDKFATWADQDRPINTVVASYNQRAIRFYEKQGFTKVPGSDYLHADVMPSYHMVREAKS